MDEAKFYLSHLIKPVPNPVTRKDGEEIFFYIQIIKSTSSEKRSLIAVENDKKRIFNAENLEETLEIVETISSAFEPFQFEILSFDVAYETDLVVFIVSEFLTGYGNLQDKINQFKINKDLK